MIKLDQVSHEYTIGAEKIHALHKLSVAVAAGECVAVAGPSGCGKSTLFHVVGGMLTPMSGSVRVDGHEFSTMSDTQRSDLRVSTIGFVFQLFHLLPYYTALQNVELPLMIAGMDPEQRRKRASQALADVGLADRSQHLPSQLSGGQMQRVSIARALIARPKLLLADEPTGNLDRKNSDGVLDLILAMNQRLGLTVLVTTHQESVMDRFPRVLQLDKGEIQNEIRR